MEELSKLVGEPGVGDIGLYVNVGAGGGVEIVPVDTITSCSTLPIRFRESVTVSVTYFVPAL